MRCPRAGVSALESFASLVDGLLAYREAEVEALKAELAHLRAESMRGAVEAISAEGARLDAQWPGFMCGDPFRHVAGWIKKQQTASQGQPECRASQTSAMREEKFTPAKPEK